MTKKSIKLQITPSFLEEKLMWDSGISHVIGIDEVGVGCFAGPVVVAGVVFDPQCFAFFEDKKHELYSLLHKINDSKKLLAKIREELSPLIQQKCIVSAITEVPVNIIDNLGIRKAMFFGMREVIRKITEQASNNCHPRPDRGSTLPPCLPAGRFRGNDNKNGIAILVDGFAIPDISHPQKHIVKGDQKCISIAAASIIAKVYRDNLMEKLAISYPNYHFEKNKGYGTKDHREAIKLHGLSELHRASFDLQEYC